jgi:hypothetical protein
VQEAKKTESYTKITLTATAKADVDMDKRAAAVGGAVSAAAAMAMAMKNKQNKKKKKNAATELAVDAAVPSEAAAADDGVPLTWLSSEPAQDDFWWWNHCRCASFPARLNGE